MGPGGLNFQVYENLVQSFKQEPKGLESIFPFFATELGQKEQLDFICFFTNRIGKFLFEEKCGETLE